ncbi:predicted protein [Nematostella vectensis]|nr:predicted protein [Nematostella vectensis]|eukprot:XP_001621670.1 hypothetical protein NEMVEDRAFT_v1g144095 [Nematostella vectensis]
MASRAPPRRGQSSEDNEDGLPAEIFNVRRHHKQAYAYIARALEVDEGQGSLETKKRAVEFYNRGIEEMEAGLLIPCIDEGEEWDKARRLQEKMEANLENTRERMDELVIIFFIIVVALLVSAGMMDDQPLLSARKTSSEPSQAWDVSKPTGPSYKQSKSYKNSTTVTTKRSQASPSFSSSSSSVNSTAGSSRTKPAKPAPMAAPRRYNPQVRRTKSTKPAMMAKQSCVDEQKKKISHLKGIDPKLANIIMDEILESGPAVHFSDIAGVDNAKKALQEIVILPSLRPELWRGDPTLVLFQVLPYPPGSSHITLPRASTATSFTSCFFSISKRSSLVHPVVASFFVKSLEDLASILTTSLFTIDEVDSLLTERREGEHEHSRRLKTEFLVSFDGVVADPEERILVMGATNRPQELDDAALRRMVKRIHIPLPDKETRKVLLTKLLAKHHNPLSGAEIDRLARMTEHYSGSDLTALARDAALGPIRDLNSDQLKSMAANEVRNITFQDFVNSLQIIRPSVGPETLKAYDDWNRLYGSNA